MSPRELFQTLCPFQLHIITSHRFDLNQQVASIVHVHQGRGTGSEQIRVFQGLEFDRCHGLRDTLTSSNVSTPIKMHRIASVWPISQWHISQVGG